VAKWTSCCLFYLTLFKWSQEGGSGTLFYG
jgi:hypothetical protein